MFGVSNIKVVNPVSSSTYSWNTIGGHFADTSISTSVFVDAPGTYIVTQKIRPDCPFYAIDTIVIPFFANCGILNTHALKFTGKLHHQSVLLSWQRTTDMPVKFYEIERSTDGIRFQQINKIFAGTNNNTTEYLGAKDDVAAIVGSFIYYRLKITGIDKKSSYSTVIKIKLNVNNNAIKIIVAPNPVKDIMKLNIQYDASKKIVISIFDCFGKLIINKDATIIKGDNCIVVDGFQKMQSGIYIAKIALDKEIFVA